MVRVTTNRILDIQKERHTRHMNYHDGGGRRALQLGCLLAVEVIGSSSIYSILENHSFADGLWWSFMTFTTVGYGDQFPSTMVGRMAGMVLVATAVFVILPTITAVIATRIIGDKDKFTHEEQEEIKDSLRRIDSKISSYQAIRSKEDTWA